MPPTSPITRIASSIVDELNNSAISIAQQLKPEIVDPQDQRTRAEFLDYMARHWDDAAFRKEVHDQNGDQGLIAMTPDILARKAAMEASGSLPPSGNTAAAQGAGQVAALTPQAPSLAVPNLVPPNLAVPTPNTAIPNVNNPITAIPGGGAPPVAPQALVQPAMPTAPVGVAGLPLGVAVPGLQNVGR